MDIATLTQAPRQLTLAGSPMAQAMRVPPAEMAAALDRANKKVGVTDADSYAKELTEGALNANKLSQDQLKALLENGATLREIATNTGKGRAPTTAGTWG